MPPAGSIIRVYADSRSQADSVVAAVPQGRTRGGGFRHGFAFTLSGAAYIVVCLMVGLAAANNQINLLFLIFGILMGGMVVGGVVSTLTLGGLRAVRKLPESAMVGQAILMAYELDQPQALAEQLLAARPRAPSAGAKRRGVSADDPADGPRRLR